MHSREIWDPVIWSLFTTHLCQNDCRISILYEAPAGHCSIPTYILLTWGSLAHKCRTCTSVILITLNVLYLHNAWYYTDYNRVYIQGEMYESSCQGIVSKTFNPTIIDGVIPWLMITYDLFLAAGYGLIIDFSDVGHNQIPELCYWHGWHSKGEFEDYLLEINNS